MIGFRPARLSEILDVQNPPSRVQIEPQAPWELTDGDQMVLVLADDRSDAAGDFLVYPGKYVVEVLGYWPDGTPKCRYWVELK